MSASGNTGDNQKTHLEKKASNKPICRFFKHGKIQTTWQLLIQWERMWFFHPNECKDSLKSKTCERDECRFYHLKGTKNPEKKGKFNSDPSTSMQQRKPKFESKNRFEVLNQEEDQVFQQDQSAIELTLAGIMRELADLATSKCDRVATWFTSDWCLLHISNVWCNEQWMHCR